MRKDIENDTLKCVSCQKDKQTFSNTKLAVQITYTPFASFDKISRDCVGPLPLKENGD